MQNNTHIKRGIAWSSIGQIGTQTISFGFGIVLARLISPTEFGILAMVTVFTGFAEIFKDLGFGAAIVQKKDVSNQDLATSFWLNILVGFVLFLIIFSTSQLVALFYNNDSVIIITRAISVNFIISSLSVVHQSLVLKKLNFKLRAILNLTSMLVCSIIGVIIAILGYGIWALVSVTMGRNLILTIGYWLIESWRPSFVFDKTSLKKLFSFGSFVTLNSILNYLNRNSDNFIIGKLLGDHSLGIYNRVYGIMLLPVRNISNGFKTVLFPSLSKIQENTKEVRRIYLKATKFVAYLTFPLMFGLSAVSEQFILFVYGEKWTDMIPLLKILSIFGAFQSLMTFNGTIFYSLGKPKFELIIYLVTTPIILLSFIVGIKINGLIGLAYCFTIASLLLMVFKLYFVFKLINLSYGQFLKNISTPIIFSTFMYFIITTINKALNSWPINLLTQLIILSLIGITIYLSTSFLFDRKTLNQLLITLKIKK